MSAVKEYSRKIVSREVHEIEAAALGTRLMRKASLAEGLAGRELVHFIRTMAAR